MTTPKVPSMVATATTIEITRRSRSFEGTRMAASTPLAGEW
jgi:hypothetical protein